MPKLNLTPERSGYAFSFGKEIISAELEGGLSRRRRDINGSSNFVDLQWVLDLGQYQYLMAFYNSALNRGVDRFTIDLVLDRPYALEYTAQFVPDSLRMQDPRGLSFIVTAQIEVLPIDNSDMDDLIITLHDAGALDGNGIFGVLEELTNVDLSI